MTIRPTRRDLLRYGSVSALAVLPALAFAGVADAAPAIEAMKTTVRSASIGKHRRKSARQQRQVLSIVKPLLLSLGYLDADREPARRSLRHPLTGWRARE